MLTYAALIAAFTAEALAFLFVMDRILNRNDRNVQVLLQRLQDPGAAVAQHAIGELSPVQHLPFEDDGAYMAYAQDILKENGVTSD